MPGAPGALALAAIGVGGGLGAMLRALLGRAVQAAAASAFPWGTLTVNLLGCAAFGAVFAVLARSPAGASNVLAAFLLTGLLGGFTTFSAFSHETLALLRAGRPGLALACAGLSLGGCLVATALGAGLGGLLGRPS